MKIHILYQFADGPWGGANQFLKALREFFRKNRVYEERPEEADAILINSHHQLVEALKLKQKNPECIFVHRLAGPIQLARDRGKSIDESIYLANKILADGTVFQSKWSIDQNYQLGLIKSETTIVIPNSVDESIFNFHGKDKFLRTQKARIVTNSWSPNRRKGFSVYQWLDGNLDFDKYEMTFIGNSPVQFRNIQMKAPMDTQSLAQELKKNDIFIFPSIIEACSNTLLEALSCGLPVVGFNGSSNPELIKEGGAVFNDPKEIPGLLVKIIKNYEHYTSNIKVKTMNEVGNEYLKFITEVSKNRRANIINQKEWRRLKRNVYLSKIENKFTSLAQLAWKK